jgi:hypothetical protein
MLTQKFLAYHKTVQQHLCMYDSLLEIWTSSLPAVLIWADVEVGWSCTFTTLLSKPWCEIWSDRNRTCVKHSLFELVKIRTCSCYPAGSSQLMMHICVYESKQSCDRCLSSCWQKQQWHCSACMKWAIERGTMNSFARLSTRTHRVQTALALDHGLASFPSVTPRD